MKGPRSWHDSFLSVQKTLMEGEPVDRFCKWRKLRQGLPSFPLRHSLYHIWAAFN